MNDDKDMLSSGFDGLERDLLRSAELLDVPSEAGKQRARAIMALGVAAGTLAAAGSAGPKAGTTTLGALTLGKGLLLGAVGLTIAGGIFYAALLLTRPAATVTAGVPTTSAVATSAEPTLADVLPSAPAVSEAVTAPPSPPQVAPSPARAVATAAPDSSAGLGDQVAALDRARDLLARGRAVEALGALADFDRRFPNGALRQEAAVTRIEALFKQGRTAEATSLANRFIATHPASSHAEHLRRLVREAAPGE